MHPFASRYVSFRLRAALSKLFLALRSMFVNFAATIPSYFSVCMICLKNYNFLHLTFVRYSSCLPMRCSTVSFDTWCIWVCGLSLVRHSLIYKGIKIYNHLGYNLDWSKRVTICAFKDLGWKSSLQSREFFLSLPTIFLILYAWHHLGGTLTGR